MPTIYPTLEEIRAGLTLPTGAKHTIVLPPMVVRVRMVGILFETDKTFILSLRAPGNPASEAGLRSTHGKNRAGVRSCGSSRRGRT